MYKGVDPSLLRALLWSIPASSSTWTTSAWPLSVARWNAVPSRSSVAKSVSAPASIKLWTLSTWPNWAAKSSAVQPWGSVSRAFRSAAASINSWRGSMYPFAAAWSRGAPHSWRTLGLRGQFSKFWSVRTSLWPRHPEPPRLLIEALPKSGDTKLSSQGVFHLCPSLALIVIHNCKCVTRYRWIDGAHGRRQAGFSGTSNVLGQTLASPEVSPRIS